MKKIEKRKRGIPYLDSIDLEILEFLDEPNYKENKNGWGVLDIVDKLEIKHNNLKPHIDKLLKLNLIVMIDMSNYISKGKNVMQEKKVGLSTIKANNDYWKDNVADFEKDKEEIKEVNKENDYFNAIIKCLQNIRKIFYEKENEEYLEMDLRKTETKERLLERKKNTK